MSDIQYTPITLWQDFNKADVDLEINAVTSRRSGYLTLKSLYFSGGIFAEYCRLSKKFPDRSMPALIIISEPGARADFGLMRRMAKEGYAVLWPDLDTSCGEDNPAPVKYDFKDPKESCWYLWGAAAMRAVTVLSAFPEVDRRKVGLIAIGKACATAGMAGAADERINRICLLFGDTSGFSYEDQYMQKQYAASLSFASYAQHIKCPVLYMGATNESAYDILDACEVLSKVPVAANSSLSLSERLDHEIGFAQSGNIAAWFDGMRKGLAPPNRPSAAFRVSEDKLYCVFNVPEGQTVSGVKAYYSYGDGPLRIRDWSAAPMQEVGAGEYVAKIAVYEKLQVSAFVSAEYGNGLALSTRIISKDFSELKISGQNPDKRRLVYSSERGTGNFTSVNNRTAFHRVPNVIMCEGPLGLPGVTNNAGCLACYIWGGPGGKGGDTLLIDIAADSSVNVKITVKDAENGEYTAEVYVKQDEWQKLSLEAKLFKTSDNLTLSAYPEAALLYFKAPRRIYIRNMLWA